MVVSISVTFKRISLHGLIRRSADRDSTFDVPAITREIACCGYRLPTDDDGRLVRVRLARLFFALYL